MALNFGATGSSGPSSGSLFGTSGTSGKSGGDIFGGGGASTGFSFGGLGQSTSSSAGESKALFGSTADNKPSGHIFGQPASSSSGTTSNTGPTLSFGKKPDDSSTPSAPMFRTPKAPTPSFGSATPAATTSQPAWGFDNPSTTPAGPPPAPSAFGASTGGSANIFGGNIPNQDPTSKTPTLSFGNPPQNSNPTTQTGSPSLFGAPQPSQTGGSATPSFFPSKPAEKPTDSPSGEAPPGGQKILFNFGKAASPSPNTTTSSSTPAFTSTASNPAAAPSLFGSTPASSQTATTQSSGPSLFSQPSATSSTDSAPKPAFSFPAAAAAPPSQSPSAPTTSSDSAKPMFTPSTTSSAAPSKSLFGTAPTLSAPSAPSTSATTSADATSSAPAFSLGAGTGFTAQPSGNTTGLAASTSGPLPPAQSRLKNKTMDEILTRWATDLTKYTKEFKTHAETIAKWDQLIVDHSSKIDKLYVKTRTCEKQTMSVEMQLSAVENQQTELESWLSKYENDVDAMLSKEGATPSELGGPDQERERTYKLAEKLNERLDDIGRDLGSMVEEVNAANASLSRNGKGDEPITQIVRILNSHLSQLQAIDQGTAALQARVVEAQKTSNGIGYLNGANGDGRAAVDDFYRSYMGRR